MYLDLTSDEKVAKLVETITQMRKRGGLIDIYDLLAFSGLEAKNCKHCSDIIVIEESVCLSCKEEMLAA